MSILLTIHALSVSLAFAGGVDTGGGTGVQGVDGKIEILDERNFGQEGSVYPLYKFQVKDLKMTVDSQLDESVFLSQLPIYETMLAKLSLWPVSSARKNLVGLVRQAMKTAQVAFISQQPQGRLMTYQTIPHHGGRYYQADSLVTLAVCKKNSGIFIYREPFNSFDSFQQQVILFHEVLREVQISMGYYISEASIQMISMALATGPTADTADVNELFDIYTFDSVN